MLGKTHIAIGAAASLALLQPESTVSCVCAAAGGALGGWINDVDVRVNRRNAIEGSIMALTVIAVVAAIEQLTGLNLHGALLNSFAPSTIAGAIGFAAVTVLGASTNHRSFTHSILGICAWSVFLWMALPPLAPAFAIGAASHVALDLLNYQNVKVFYPFKKGISLDLCQSDGIVNKTLGAIGGVAAAALLIYFLFSSVISDIGGTEALEKSFGAIFGS